MSCEIHQPPTNPTTGHQMRQQGLAKNDQKSHFWAKFGRFWSKNPNFYWREQKFWYPHNKKSIFLGDGVKLLVSSYQGANETPFQCWKYWPVRLKLAEHSVFGPKLWFLPHDPLGETVHFPPWGQFFDFLFPSYCRFLKKKKIHSLPLTALVLPARRPSGPRARA